MFDQQRRQITESMMASRWKRVLQNALPRISRGLPSIILAVLLNALDAASTGLLVFPSAQQGPAFAGLQVQAMSIYIMSTIMSQLVMTLGGSLFPGALGSMLIEVLPFVRGIAADIQDSLGAESPKLLPTVMAAYAMTSFLIAFCFLALGFLRLGWMVEYIPSTVLNGTIGAIGLSLFALGLELTLPPATDDAASSPMQNVLFTAERIPLLATTILPTIVLCVSMRSERLSKLTKGLTEHSMYVPAYVISIAVLFWIIVTIQGSANDRGMEALAAKGWLFTVQKSSGNSSGLEPAWNYWQLFDFHLIEWSAMGAAVQNILLLLIIGVLNLPIFIPAMGVMLDEPSYNMNWELIGHGLSNLFSGAVGSLPNLVVLANSRLFTFAGGGRLEALVATGFTIILFFFSGHLLTFVPTIVASILVLFLGLDLVIEALWTSALELMWSEWMVVLGTVLACTFIDFLPGFFIGLGLAILQHFGWEMHDSRASTITIYPRLHAGIRRPPALADAHHNDCETLPWDRRSSGATLLSTDGDDYACDVPKDVIIVHGNQFFASIPSLEKQLDVALSQSTGQVILDFGKTERCETCVGQLIRRKVQQYASDTKPWPLSLAGVQPDSGLVLDLSRGGVTCFWPHFSKQEITEKQMLCYADLKHALRASPSPPRSLASEVSDEDYDVLEDADELLGGLSQEHSIRAAYDEGLLRVHCVPAGRHIQIRGPSYVLIVRGDFKVRGDFEPLHKSTARRLDHTGRKALATTVAAALHSLLEKCRYLRLRGEVYDDESGPERAPLLRSIDGDVILRRGDCCYTEGPAEPGQDSEAQLLTAMREACWAISLGANRDVAFVRALLARLERRRQG